MRSLRYLNLSNVSFEGQIPYEISHLRKMSILDLSTSFTSNHTLKLERPNIGMLMQNLTKITELYLDGVRVSAVGKEWCLSLSSLQKLQVLSMSSCNLSGPIDSSLSTLQSLSVLKLKFNNMSSSVPESFENLSSLTTLDLSSCGLTNVFPKGIFQIPKLKVIDLSYNQDLCGSLPNFRGGYLQFLNVGNTNFSGQLPSAISNLKHLSIVDVSNSQFCGTLPDSFSRLTQLVHLDLSFNNFTGSLPPLNMSKNLIYVSLLHSGFVGPIPSTYLKGLANLLILNLGDNFLNGKVTSSLLTHPSLQELTLSLNGFDDVLDEFSNASSSALKLVDLSGNKLQGTIPVSLFHLRKLDFLQLSLNQFNGTIQLDIFWRLPNLLSLGLSHNNLSVDATFNDDPNLSSYINKRRLLLASCKLKEFPTFLRDQSQLISLDLSNNQIQGIIPNWIWIFDFMLHLNLSNNFLTELQGPFENLTSKILVLDLHSNQLRGSIPIFTKYAGLLDYSSNRFSFIPPETSKYIHFAYFLSLSNNTFYGKIYEFFCGCSTLRMLDLSHNNFNGFIPECLIRSDTLRVLNLAGNKLSGHISDTFSSTCDLRFLDLNGNLLGGTIPNSLVNCKMLEAINLRNNLLSDIFPCFLKKVSTLRFLILRSNKLHGSIRCTHNSSNWEMLHVVDLASNNFTGTLPGMLLQSWIAMTGVKNKALKKPGNLFFDMYGFHDFVNYKDVLSLLNKVVVKNIAKMERGENLSVIEHMLSYIANVDQLHGTYLDSVIVVNKGMQMKLVKILAVLTSLDLSSNHFEGPIPEELTSFKALNVLNLSHNAFSRHIPSSFGNLTQLESLDLSNNSLSGEIPTQMASLCFLSVLNLSFNYLVGKILTGTQIQSFKADSFEGNEGLCGPPLTKNCDDGEKKGLPKPSFPILETLGLVEWNFLSLELGYICGFGLVILPLIYRKRWRLWYSKHLEDLLYKIFPQLDFVYENRGGQRYKILRWRHS
ncbi:hypothetical protein VNO78_12915 [Psophocarpus tetragonolobus]|uniref:Receptor-like protein 12 n=1 Tax=Psophocarpus tetragonolobus TaxID=3891 RepID=A0AAN9SQJ7_PSOTE